MNKQIKGLAVAASVQRLKSNYGEEVFQKVLNELNEEDKKIFNGNILSSIWYPLNSFAHFLKAEVKVIYKGDRTKLRIGSEAIVEHQLKGIYKFFVKLGSPEFIVGRVGAINNSYFNGIELEKEITKGRFVGRYYGYEKDQDEFEEIIIGFYKKALEISGAKNIDAKFDIPINAGKEFAQIIVTWQ